MIRSYSICGLKVQCDFRYNTMCSRSEKYLSEDTSAKPDMVIPYPEEQIKALCKAQPHISPEEAENMLTAEAFYTNLLRFNGFMLHSSAVAVDGKAYLFSAPSGTGKSTHTSLWKEVFGDRAVIINDDKPAIMLTDSGIFAYGTPWSGKSDLNVNYGVPVQGICVLERSENNFIKRLPDGDAVFGILNQTLRPTEEDNMSVLLDYIDRLIGAVSVWRMGCNISMEAVSVAYNAMS